MSYQEKRNTILIISQLAFLAGYIFLALTRYRAGQLGPDDLKPWAAFILIAAAVSVVLMIVVQILFHIGLAVGTATRKGDASEQEIEEELEALSVEDEMDKFIGLKAGRASSAAIGFGFLAALVSLLLGASHAIMINIIFLSGVLGMIAESALAIIYYRRGLRHGY